MMGTHSCNNSKKNKKNKKRGGIKKKMTIEQSIAYKSVTEWVYLDTNVSISSADSTIAIDDDFKVKLVNTKVSAEKLVFDLHSHSICSDGFLSPTKLVERAHQYGVCISLYFCLFFLIFFWLSHFIKHLVCITLMFMYLLFKAC